MFKDKKGQSALEYALVIGVAIVALLAVNMYMKKGIQGRLKESTDQIGRQFDTANGFVTSWMTRSSGNTVTTERRTPGGNITTNITGTEVVNRSEWDTFGGNTGVPGQHFNVTP
jgi:Flp pilus assembly pilin Flp